MRYAFAPLSTMPGACTEQRGNYVYANWMIDAPGQAAQLLRSAAVADQKRGGGEIKFVAQSEICVAGRDHAGGGIRKLPR